MSHPIRLHLILACDLTPDGLSLGPRSVTRSRCGSEYAASIGASICVAATFSPDHPGQQLPMSTLMKDELASYTSQQVYDLQGEGEFNTRGEARKFIDFAQKMKVPLGRLSVSSAWWHIKRVPLIFEQEFGREVSDIIHFQPTAEDFPFSQRWREWMKTVHLRVPILRTPMEKTAKRLGIRSSF